MNDGPLTFALARMAGDSAARSGEICDGALGALAPSRRSDGESKLQRGECESSAALHWVKAHRYGSMAGSLGEAPAYCFEHVVRVREQRQIQWCQMVPSLGYNY